MLGPDLLLKAYRRIRSRRFKATAVTAMRRLGMRYLVVRMDTTNLCNLRCRMCYYSAERPRRRAGMDTDLFKKIAKEIFPKTRFLYLSCATEPLMNKDFARFIELTGRYRLPFTSFCTNGMLLNELVIDAAIEARISEIIFSVDGATPETYEYIRRGARQETLIAKLQLLRSLKDRHKSELPAGRINFTCMQRNISEMPAVVRFAHQHEIRSVHVRHLLAFADDAEGLNCQEQMRYQESFNAIAQESRREADRLGVTLFLPDAVQKETPSRSPTQPGHRNQQEANPYCMIPWFEAVIAPTGNYRLCSAFPPFGNLRNQSFDEIYNGRRMRDLRRKLMTRAPDACSWTCRQEAYEAKPPTQKTAEGLAGAGESTTVGHSET